MTIEPERTRLGIKEDFMDNRIFELADQLRAAKDKKRNSMPR